FARNGIDPKFYEDIPVHDDASYMILRCRQTHDILHVLLGASTTLEGEVFVQGFVYAQTHARLSPLALSVTVIHTFLKSPSEVPALVEKFLLGFNLGRRAAPFLAVRWSEHWARPLSEVRAELGFEV